MTPEKREELRRLAEKAHQTSSGQDWLDRILTRWLNGHDEAFIRAANPAAVLYLLAEVERLRARLERVESKVREFSHAEACAVDDTFDPDDTDGCVCVLKVLAE